jgi:hypothetical protein
MGVDEILEQWEHDAKIDQTEISSEAIKIPKLHHKYYSIFLVERLKLKKMEADHKKLKLDKYEFYSQGHNEMTRKMGWTLPAKGMILKGDIPMYMDADRELTDSTLSIEYQREKVDLLDAIIKTLNNRGYLLKTALDFQRFTMGG